MLLRIWLLWGVLWWTCSASIASDNTQEAQPFVIQLHRTIRSLKVDEVRQHVQSKQPKDLDQILDDNTALGLAVGLIPIKDPSSHKTLQLIDIIDTLLDAGASPDAYTKIGEDWLTPLMMLVIHPVGYDLAIKLMQYGANIYACHSPEKLYLTPVILASYMENEAMLTYWQKEKQSTKRYQLEQEICLGKSYRKKR